MFGSSYYGFHREIANEIDYLNLAYIEYKRSFLPRKCCVSGESIWMRKAYKCSRKTFSTENIQYYEKRWYSKDQFLLIKLREN